MAGAEMTRRAEREVRIVDGSIVTAPHKLRGVPWTSKVGLTDAFYSTNSIDFTPRRSLDSLSEPVLNFT